MREVGTGRMQVWVGGGVVLKVLVSERFTSRATMKEVAGAHVVAKQAFDEDVDWYPFPMGSL